MSARCRLPVFKAEEPDLRKRLSAGERGSFLVYRPGSGGTVEILDVHVDAGERGQGVGRLLVEEVFRRVQDGTLVWAVTRCDNAIAQHFYEALHFRVVAVLRSFYTTDLAAPTSVDAIMYGRNKGSAA